MNTNANIFQQQLGVQQAPQLSTVQVPMFENNFNLVPSMNTLYMVQNPLAQLQLQQALMPQFSTVHPDINLLQSYFNFGQNNAGFTQSKMKQDLSVPVSRTASAQVWGEDPHSSARVKGQIYIVKGVRKKWDGKRFARCCISPSCPKLAQGATRFCKAHGGGSRCCVGGCPRAARGGSYYCANHGMLRSSGKRRKNRTSDEKPAAE